MPVTGWKSPGTCASVARTGGDYHWQLPDKAKVEDADCTWCYGPTVNGDYTSHWLRCTNFGFTGGDLPENALIVGIEVSYKCYYTCPGGTPGTDYVRDSSLRLRDSTGQVGDDKADTGTDWPWSSGNLAYVYRGGASDDWNAGLSRDDIIASTFGIDLSAWMHKTSGDGIEPYLDHMRVRIYYVLAAIQPPYFLGDPAAAYGGAHYLLGSPEVVAQSWRWLLGDPAVQLRAQRYFAGDVDPRHGRAGYVLGSPDVIFGRSRYFLGVITVVPRIPKPMHGAWFQRMTSIKKEV